MRLFEPFLFALALMVLSTGCEPNPASQAKHAPVEKCTRVGQRCKMGKNKLGVCESNDGGDHLGKLFCRSQH